MYHGLPFFRRKKDAEDTSKRTNNPDGLLIGVAALHYPQTAQNYTAMGNPELGPNPPWYIRALDPTLEMGTDLVFEMKQTHLSQVDTIYGYTYRLAACIALARGQLQRTAYGR